MSMPNSDDQILLLHNPKCSKSRVTLAWLEEKGVDFETRLYLEAPLDVEELAELGRRLGKRTIEFTRTNQNEFEEAGLTADSTDAEILEAMAGAPILLERPVVIRGERAAIGRPLENVARLVES